LRCLIPLIKEAESLREQGAAEAPAKEHPSLEIARAVAFTFAKAEAENSGELAELLALVAKGGQE
jgi:hypothetical protein